MLKRTHATTLFAQVRIRSTRSILEVESAFDRQRGCVEAKFYERECPRGGVDFCVANEYQGDYVELSE